MANKHWFPKFRNLESAKIHTQHVASEFNTEKDNFGEVPFYELYIEFLVNNSIR